jgi:hypothetical protein
MRSIPIVCLQCAEDEPTVKGNTLICAGCGYTEKPKKLPPSKGRAISVTEEDINKAEELRQKGAMKGAIYWGPVAQALVRDGYTDVAVSHDFFCANDKLYAATDEVRDAVDKFDEGKEIKPFDFLIEEDL